MLSLTLMRGSHRHGAQRHMTTAKSYRGGAGGYLDTHTHTSNIAHSLHFACFQDQHGKTHVGRELAEERGRIERELGGRLKQKERERERQKDWDWEGEGKRREQTNWVNRGTRTNREECTNWSRLMMVGQESPSLIQLLTHTHTHLQFVWSMWQA